MPVSVLDWGIQLILSLQNLGDWLIGPLNFFTFFGSEDFFLLLFPLLYWCVESQLGIRIGMYLILNSGLNLLLKASFHDPRPYWYDAQVKLLTGAEHSFGIPSGHAQYAVAIWVGLASQIRRGWAWIVAILLALFIGFSRIYLGVHFPTDVFAGWILGLLFLVLLIRLEKPVVNWLKKLGMWQKIGLFFVISLVFILANFLIVQTVSSSFTLPTVWVENAIRSTPDDPITPLSLSDIVTVMGVAFGLVSGVVWLEKRGGFNVQGEWSKRVLRFIVGLIGVVVLRAGLDAVFSMMSDDLSTLGYVLRYIRYGVIGLWISALAPMLFIRMRLAENSRQVNYQSPA